MERPGDATASGLQQTTRFYLVGKATKGPQRGHEKSSPMSTAGAEWVSAPTEM